MLSIGSKTPVMEVLRPVCALKRKHSLDSGAENPNKRLRTSSDSQVSVPAIYGELKHRTSDTSFLRSVNPLLPSHVQPIYDHYHSNIEFNNIHTMTNPLYCPSAFNEQSIHSSEQPYLPEGVSLANETQKLVSLFDANRAQSTHPPNVDLTCSIFDETTKAAVDASISNRVDESAECELPVLQSQRGFETETTETKEEPIDIQRSDHQEINILLPLSEALPEHVVLNDMAPPAKKKTNFEQDLPEQSQTPVCEPIKPSIEDEDFLSQVKSVLTNQSKWKTLNVGRRQARRTRQLLDLASPPNTSEALFLSGEGAAKQVECGKFFAGPIVTEHQQTLPLQTVEQFLNEFYNDDAKVWIQDPSILLSRNIPHAREITIGQLKQRFLHSDTKPKVPWNCLEMATHVEDGLRPAFLNNEDCRLLTKVKLPNAADSASRRGYEPGWKEVEKWALLAQGGALTEPHQDSHGYSTYITLNQGVMGFGWLSNPTSNERADWNDSPSTFTGGNWRYIVLRPGQTVYFPSGTVHFVFRLATMGDTLAFGGHVLRCSQIVRWIEAILEEKFGPDVTNEYLTVSAVAYLGRVEGFVRQALESGKVARWGGKESIERFLELKAKFVDEDEGGAMTLGCQDSRGR